MAILISSAVENEDRRIRPRMARAWHGAVKWRTLGLWVWLLCACGLGTGHLCAEVVSREYPLKAIFLLNFARFTDWPTNALAEPNAPFVIGVLGTDPFGDVLNDAVREENWNGHPISVQRYPRIEDLRTCHVLFISGSETRHIAKIAAGLKGKPVLTVTDIDNGISAGVIVQFVTRNNKIHFKINANSLRDAGLVMSSKLLRLAEIVPAPNQ